MSFSLPYQHSKIKDLFFCSFGEIIILIGNEFFVEFFYSSSEKIIANSILEDQVS